MRTTPALIAATFCALALSGGAWAQGPNAIKGQTPSWLEFRTAFAAEHFWPKRQSKLKSGMTVDVSSRASISDVIARSYQEASDFLYDWRKAATRAVPDQRRTFDLAEN